MLSTDSDRFLTIETNLPLFKKFLLFATEIVFLFFGFIFSMGVGVYLHFPGSKSGPVAFLLNFSLICIALIWFRRKTLNWAISAEATAWLRHRSWRRLHPRHAKYPRMLKRSLLWFPSFYSMLVLFFLPIASHGPLFRHAPRASLPIFNSIELV